MKILPKGTGYYRLDFYPLGGDFKRAESDLEVNRILVDFRLDLVHLKNRGAYHGTTHKVILSNGHTAAIDMGLTKESN